jgi:hypothetical protein
VISLAGVYALVGQWGGPFLATSWYIAVIISLYVFYPVLSRFIRFHARLSLFVFFAISAVSRYITGKYQIPPMRPLDWFTPNRLFEFGLGIYLAHSVRISRIVTAWRWDKGSIVIGLLSETTFPAFLIHFPLLSFLPALAHMFTLCPAILIYVIITMVVSILILKLAGLINDPQCNLFRNAS